MGELQNPGSGLDGTRGGECFARNSVTHGSEFKTGHKGRGGRISLKKGIHTIHLSITSLTSLKRKL